MVQSQDELHETYGGVVPEIAGRAHAERIGRITDHALIEANTSFAEIDAVAVAHRPGLIGSVLVGVAAAKSVAWRLGIPLIGVHHVEPHLWSGLLEESSPPGQPWDWSSAVDIRVCTGWTHLFGAPSWAGPLTMPSARPTTKPRRCWVWDGRVGFGWTVPLSTGTTRHTNSPCQTSKGRPLDFSFSGLKTAVRYGVLGSARNRPSESLIHSLKNARMPRHRFRKAAVRTLIRGLLPSRDKSIPTSNHC